MSLRVIGYRDGRRILEDEGPSGAYIPGGVSLGFGFAPTAAPLPVAPPLPKSRPVCGARMLGGEVCARRPRHADGGNRGPDHRSVAAMERARRRKTPAPQYTHPLAPTAATFHDLCPMCGRPR